MDELKVGDIMETEVVTVGPSTTVRELAEILAKEKISGVPVVDDQRRVVGMVSEADIILQDADLHFPYYIQLLDSVIYLQSFAKFEERFRKAFGSKVTQIMSEEVIAISPHASVRDAATLMADRKVNRLPVVAEGTLVGIVTRGDIVQAIADSRA
ncbi:MAG: CBS domain-containing protein [bacterium]